MIARMWLPQWIIYLWYRKRLINLNRKLADSTWWRDRLLVQLLDQLKRGLAGVVALALGIALPVGWFLNGEFSLRALLLTAGGLVVVETINGVRLGVRRASIRLAMLQASTSLDGAAHVGAIWEAGKGNNAFLEGLFAQYEPFRHRLLDTSPASVNPIVPREIVDSSGELAGVWVLPLSTDLTQVVVNTPDPEVVTARHTGRLEARLPRYASPALAHARTRFLAQWRRSRTVKASSVQESPPVTALDGHALDAACRREEEGLNYVVRGLSVGAGKVTVNVDRAGYGQIMRSCDFLIEEALIAAGLCATDHTGRPALQPKGPWIMRMLPARRAVMKLGPSELLLRPRHRAVGMSLAAVVVTKKPDGTTTMFYKKRSHEVSTYVGMYHAVPSGMFNAKSRDTYGTHDQRLHAGRVLLTEYVEELKNAHDLDGFDADPQWTELLTAHLDWLFRDPAGYHARPRPPIGSHEHAGDHLERLLTAAPDPVSPPAYQREELRIWVTGLAFDLLALRAEICCVLEVPHGPITRIHLNSEADQSFPFPSPDVPTRDQLPTASEWVRSGYAAMTLAFERVADGLDPSTARTPKDFGL